MRPEPHAWHECTPHLVRLRGSDDGDDALVAEILAEVWTTLTDAEKATYHRFTCLERTDRRHAALMDKVARMVGEEYQRRKSQEKP